jgi:hypothetical protein
MYVHDLNYSKICELVLCGKGLEPPGGQGGTPYHAYDQRLVVSVESGLLAFQVVEMIRFTNVPMPNGH